jgi:hypothetical protein
MPLPDGILWLFGASLITSLICLVALIAVWIGFARQAAGAREQILQLEHKIGVATSGAIGMGNRIVALERKLQALQEKQETIGGVDEFAYSQALQMFEQGADVATVASNCGFSASEAQLMALVQQQLRKPAKPSARKTPAKSSHDA